MRATLDVAAEYRAMAEDLVLRRQSQGRAAPTAGLTSSVDTSNIKTSDDLMSFAQTLTADHTARVGARRYDTNDALPSDTYAARRHEFLKESEGERLTAYDDISGKFITRQPKMVGKVHVGVGFNMERPDARQVWKKAGMQQDFDAVFSGKASITPEESRRLFDYTIGEAESFVGKRFNDANLPEHKRLALVSMAFNLPALLGPNITKMIKEGDDDGVMDAILNHSNKKRDKGLAKRRYAEAGMWAGSSTAKQRLPRYDTYLSQF